MKQSATFNKGDVIVIRGIYALAKLLSKRRLLEFMMSMFAMLYGSALAVFGTSALNSLKYKPSGLLVGSMPNMYGTLILFTGMMGMIGLYRHNRSMRLTSAMCLAVTWGGLALHYLFSQPPIQTAAVVHGFHSLMEAFIFLRVFANLDHYWVDKGE